MIKVNYDLKNKQGMMGEDELIKKLSLLGDEYYIFRDRNINVDNKQIQFNFIVLGPTGLFVIENNHDKGRIIGDTSEDQWLQEKVGQRGSLYKVPFYNPQKKVDGDGYILDQFLKNNDISTVIKGVVFFSNFHTKFSIVNDSETPLFGCHDREEVDIVSYILENKNSIPTRIIQKTVELLKSL